MIFHIFNIFIKPLNSINSSYNDNFYYNFQKLFITLHFQFIYKKIFSDESERLNFLSLIHCIFSSHSYLYFNVNLLLG